VVTAEVEVEELLPPVLARPLPRRLLRHHAEGARAYLVERALEHTLDLVEREIDELLREVEDVTHAHAEEDVALPVLARAGLEVALDLAQLLVRLPLLETANERGSRQFDHG